MYSTYSISLFLTFVLSISATLNAQNDIIVVGVVADKFGTESPDRSTITTDHLITVEEVLAGSVVGEPLVVKTEGGAVDGAALYVTHQPYVRNGKRYLFNIAPSIDGTSGTYWLRSAISDRDAAFNQTLQQLRAEPHTSDSPDSLPDPCEVLDRGQGGDSLLLRFGSINLASLNDQTIIGYVDAFAAVNSAAQTYKLASLDVRLGYDASRFGSYAIGEEGITVSHIDSNLADDYEVIAQDESSETLSFSLNTLDQSQTRMLLSDHYRPVVRISFELPISALYELPDRLSEILAVEMATASFECKEGVQSFDGVGVVDGEPVVKFCEGSASTRITYSFHEFTYTSPNQYEFTIYAESSTTTDLRQATLVIGYEPTTFQSGGFGSGAISIVSDINSIINLNGAAYPVATADVGITQSRLTLGTASGTPPATLATLTAGVARPLVRIRMLTSECNRNPLLSFIQGAMNSRSFYQDPALPDRPVAYCDVVATDGSQVHPCGCTRPTISGFTPDNIVAGDNQLLTITGSGFGVYNRGDDPSNSGTGSSVLFTNGDQSGGAWTAVSDKDLRDDDFDIMWSDTEIQVRVPSTNWERGFQLPAASGPIRVRNGCNDSRTSSQDLDIPYALTNFRSQRDGIAKKVGLREQVAAPNTGYVLRFNPSMSQTVNGVALSDIFTDALSEWCAKVGADFKIGSQPFQDMNIIGDNVNAVSVTSSGSQSAVAGLFRSFGYFRFSCKGRDESTYAGGYIYSDLDFTVAESFLSNSNIPEIEKRQILGSALRHELGHAHQLSHAHTVTGQPQPLMKAEVDASSTNYITPNDSAGGNRILTTSAAIIATTQGTCQDNLQRPVQLRPILNTGCGSIVSVDEVQILTELPYKVLRNQGGVVLLEVKANIEELNVVDALGRTLSSRIRPHGLVEFDDLHRGNVVYLTAQTANAITTVALRVNP